MAEKLLFEIAEGSVEGDESARVQQLLAWLLEYHWREAKPVFWRMFDRHEKTEQELIDDFDCLGGLSRTENPPREVKRSMAYEYHYDPDQDTKLHEGKGCFFAHDLDVKPTIESLDADVGLVEIKLGPKYPEPPEALSLIPNEYVPANVISDAVHRYVEEWSHGTVLSQAVDDLIHRCRPRIKGVNSGPIVPEGKDLVAGVVDAVLGMDETVLCIQGPPGTGKTYTAAVAILELLNEGKRVGITANSHKVIMNLMEAVHRAMKEAGLNFRLVKVGGDEDEPLIKSGEIEFVKSSGGAVEALGSGPLVMGGTAWVFSREELGGKIDYLFIDEAGQFSLANVVATGISAKNIVLVGDQMQLAQPIKGSHPGDSGKSALVYLLDGLATIPPDFGIFLDMTWRMHPRICSFISDAVYYGRLVSHPDTEHQRVVLSADGGSSIEKEAGTVFVPVEHEGNSQVSEEEVAAIQEIIDELVGKKVHGFSGGRPAKLTLNDILLVAPFNMQVRLLQQRLGADARVGSVDKFQGQEAHVVIVSMCSSSLEDSPRGAEFLLNPNRINVAVSRARSLAIVVGCPGIVAARCQTIEEMELVNLFCWLVEHSRG